MRYKEKSFGEGVLDTWYFFVDDLLPVFVVGGLLMGAIMAVVLTIIVMFGL